MSEAPEREYQEKLGQDFGTVFYGVRNDWLNGLVRLKEYRVLFGDPAAVKLLNAIGGGFMGDVQQVLWRDLLPHSCFTSLALPTPRRRANTRTSLFRGYPHFANVPSYVLSCRRLSTRRFKLLNSHGTGAIGLLAILTWIWRQTLPPNHWNRRPSA